MQRAFTFACLDLYAAVVSLTGVSVLSQRQSECEAPLVLRVTKSLRQSAFYSHSSRVLWVTSTSRDFAR